MSKVNEPTKCPLCGAPAQQLKLEPGDYTDPKHGKVWRIWVCQNCEACISREVAK